MKREGLPLEGAAKAAFKAYRDAAAGRPMVGWTEFEAAPEVTQRAMLAGVQAAFESVRDLEPRLAAEVWTRLPADFSMVRSPVVATSMLVAALLDVLLEGQK